MNQKQNPPFIHMHVYVWWQWKSSETGWNLSNQVRLTVTLPALLIKHSKSDTIAQWKKSVGVQYYRQWFNRYLVLFGPRNNTDTLEYVVIYCMLWIINIHVLTLGWYVPVLAQRQRWHAVVITATVSTPISFSHQWSLTCLTLLKQCLNNN